MAVAMKRISDKSKASSTNESRKRPCCSGSSTSRSTAAGAGPDLVDLVEHDNRVPVADPPELAEDRAGLRPVPGTVMPPQLRVVMESAARQPDVATPQGLGDGLGQRRLAGAGRAEETEDGAGAARVPLARGQVTR